MSEYGLSDEGYRAPLAVDILAVIQSSYETETGLSIDWSADTVLGKLSAICADRIAAIADASQALYDSFSVASAVGASLDSLALLVGVARRAASRGTATITLTGTSGTVIPDGSVIVGGGDDGLTRWITQSSVTLSGGTGSVLVQCEDAGVIEADAAAISNIATPVSGWTAATNADPADAGLARETDAELRARRLLSLQVAGSRSLNAIRGRLLACDGVEAAVAVDNQTAASAVVEGISIDPFSIGIVLHPNTLTATQQAAVAAVIYAHAAGGRKTCGAVEYDVTDTTGYTQTVRWGWATDQPVVVAVVVTRYRPGYELADVEQPALDALADLFLAYGCGDDAALIAAQAVIYGVEGILDATVTLDGASATVVASATVILTLDPASSVT